PAHLLPSQHRGCRSLRAINRPGAFLAGAIEIGNPRFGFFLGDGTGVLLHSFTHLLRVIAFPQVVFGLLLDTIEAVELTVRLEHDGMLAAFSRSVPNSLPAGTLMRFGLLAIAFTASQGSMDALSHGVGAGT